MAKMKFTHSRVENLRLSKRKYESGKKKGQPIEQEDFFEKQRPGRTLVLTVGKEKKTWSALFYEKGKPRRKKLGHFSEMNCKAARQAAGAFDDEKAIAAAKSGTFEAVAETYLKRHVQARGLRSESEIKRLLQTNVYESWATKRFAEISRRDVADLLDDIEDRSGPGVADSTLAVIRGLMRWYQTRDGDYICPVVPGMTRRGPVRRTRWLDDDEIERFWCACELELTYGAACRVLLLTGQRLTKVLNMKWSDVDLDSGEWIIPREKREKGAPKAITLLPLALDLVRTQFRVAGNPFVFAGQGENHIRATSTAKERLDAELNFDKPWRLHDLRRTCRKLMTRAKVSTEVAELALGHSIKGIQSVYDDPDEYRPMIDEALRRVEVEIQRILMEDDSPGPTRRFREKMQLSEDAAVTTTNEEGIIIYPEELAGMRLADVDTPEKRRAAVRRARRGGTTPKKPRQKRP